MRLIMENWRKFISEQTEEYTVQSGDTLSKIARTNNTTVKVLADLNKDTIKNIDKIFVGQKVKIPSQRPENGENGEVELNVLDEMSIAIGNRILGSGRDRIASSLKNVFVSELTAKNYNPKRPGRENVIQSVQDEKHALIDRIYAQAILAIDNDFDVDEWGPEFKEYGVISRPQVVDLIRGYCLIYRSYLLSAEGEPIEAETIQALMGKNSKLFPELQDAFIDHDGLDSIRSEALKQAENRLNKKITLRRGPKGDSAIEIPSDQSLKQQIAAEPTEPDEP